MRQEEFDRLVRRLEGRAASHPRLYKLKTGLLALPYYERGGRGAELLEQAKAERDAVSPSDIFLPHGLAREDLDAVTQQLSRYPKLHKASLVRKDVKLFPGFPQYVLGVAIRFPWYGYVSQRRLNNLHLKIAGELGFPFPAIVINLSIEGPEGSGRR